MNISSKTVHKSTINLQQLTKTFSFVHLIKDASKYPNSNNAKRLLFYGVSGETFFGIIFWHYVTNVVPGPKKS